MSRHVLGEDLKLSERQVLLLQRAICFCPLYCVDYAAIFADRQLDYCLCCVVVFGESQLVSNLEWKTLSIYRHFVLAYLWKLLEVNVLSHHLYCTGVDAVLWIAVEYALEVF